MRWEDHLVARPDPACTKRQRQRCRARRDSDAMPHFAVIGELTLETLYLFAQDEPASDEHTSECLMQLFLDFGVLSIERRKRDLLLRSSVSAC